MSSKLLEIEDLSVQFYIPEGLARAVDGVSFDLAATVFRDPLMISIPGEEHSETKECWITMGLYCWSSYLSRDQRQRIQCADHLCSARD